MSTTLSIDSFRFMQMSFKYDPSRPIFEKIDFDFPMNDFVWIRSEHTGAGRSTLMQILAGLLPVSAGKYFINDQCVSDMSFEQFLPFRLLIGYSFDMGGLLHNKTLFENLMLPLIYHNRCSYEDAKDKVRHHMETMGIWRYKDQRPSAVPGGVRKITCLLRPLLGTPQLLLLDDPSLGLGQEAVVRYVGLINNMREHGLAKHVYISTFDEKMMSLVPHREVSIDQGSLLNLEPILAKKVVSL